MTGKIGFVITAPSRVWSGDANGLIERITAIVTAAKTQEVDQSEWTTLFRQLSEVMANSNGNEFCQGSKATHLDALITALGGTV